MIYTVVKDDTLLGIAARFGITLDEMLAANPGIDPNFLTIGMTIVIPAGENNPGNLPTATAIPLTVHPPRCFPVAQPGVWCLSRVSNPSAEAVENISGLITLGNGNDRQSQLAHTPLNRLGAGDATVLMAYFELTTSQGRDASIELISALPLSDPARYLTIETRVDQILYGQAHREAVITGQVIPANDQTSGAITVMALAVDRDGNPVGVRVWSPAGEIPAGASLPFEITVYSLGPEINQIEITAEARP
jgi:LysM repeat protein